MAAYTAVDGTADYPFLLGMGTLVLLEPTIGEDYEVGTWTMPSASWFDPELDFNDAVDFPPDGGKGMESPREVPDIGGGSDTQGYW